jgi:hypothetical protein
MPFVKQTRMKIIRTVSIAILLTGIITVTPAFAQSAARETALIAGAGIVNFDLSGTGTKPGFTVRVSRELGSGFVLEGGFLYTEPNQQFGESRLIIPEAQLQYHYRAGRFTPYLGAGLGIARQSADDLDSDWNAAISFAGGTRVAVSDRVGLFGELRIRGIEWDFAGTVTDVMGGVAIKLGR